MLLCDKVTPVSSNTSKVLDFSPQNMRAFFCLGCVCLAVYRPQLRRTLRQGLANLFPVFIIRLQLV